MVRRLRALRARLFRCVPRRLRWVRRLRWREVSLLFAALLVVFLADTFFEIADDVAEGETQTLDERVVVSLRRPDDLAVPVGPAWLRTAALDVTALGSITVLGLVSAVVAGYLTVYRHWRLATLVLGTAAGGLTLNIALKHHYARERPDVVPHLREVSTPSFPSGHANLSAVVYLTLGTLLVRASRGRLGRAYCLGVAMLLTFLVGISRVYLGVHYPTDVMAGWLLGLGWALSVWLLVRASEVKREAAKRKARP